MKNLTQGKDLARFTNDFALNAEIGFTDARQLLLFLALVSQTNPQDSEEEMTGILSLQDIFQLILKKGARKSGNLYQELSDFTDKMMESNYVKFSPSADIQDKEAKKYLKDYGVIFDRLKLFKEGKATFYEYRFHEDMRPHIKRLKENFVSLSIPKGMKSGHAIRFLVLAKAHHDKYRKGGKVKVTKKIIAIADLRRILGIEKKYKEFDNLRRRVIEPIIAEINKSGFLFIPQHKYIKTGRKKTHIEFWIEDGELYQKTKKDAQVALKSPENAFKAEGFVPAKEQETELKIYQYLAYQYLVERKIVKGIAFRQIVPNVPSSECEGWEDIYFEYAWKLFEGKTKYKQAKRKAGAFVKWYISGEFKDRHFPEIMEKLVAEKKRMQRDDAQRWSNRETVKDMSYTQFQQWLEQERKKKRKGQKNNDNSGIKKDINNLVNQMSAN